MTIANIKISSDYRLDLISIASGQSDPEKYWYSDDTLYVEGISQSALNIAAKNPEQYGQADKIQSQIDALEETITSRRFREAALDTDHTNGGWQWLEDVNNKIIELRNLKATLN